MAVQPRSLHVELSGSQGQTSFSSTALRRGQVPRFLQTEEKNFLSVYQGAAAAAAPEAGWKPQVGLGGRAGGVQSTLTGARHSVGPP